MADKTLADLEPESVDVTPDVSAENFDIDAFVDGARSVVRAYRIYARPDLLAEIDVLERKIEADRKKGEDVEALETDLDGLYRTLVDSGRWFHVQGRSDSWKSGVAKAVKKRGGTREDVVFEQVAQSIVSPEGVTADHLRRLAEIDEAQIKALVVCWTMACNAPTRVTAPFSHAPSKGDTA